MVTDVLLLMFFIGYVSFCTTFHKKIMSSSDDELVDKLTEWLVAILIGWFFTPLYFGSFFGTKIKKEMDKEEWINDVLKELNK